MTQTKLVRIEIALSFLMFGFGLLMDFSSYLSHQATWSQLISGVNGSVWESFKPFMIAFFVLSLLELGAVRISVVRFVTVHVIGLYIYTVLGLFVASLYGMGWTYYIAVFVVGMVCRLGTTAFLFTNRKPQILFIPALVALALYFLMLIFFTPCPPHTPLFYDVTLGKYGI